MKYILTITLALLLSLNAFADGHTALAEEQYIKEAQEQGAEVYVAKIFTDDGKRGYHLYAQAYFRGRPEIKAGQICLKKGYKVLREESAGLGERRWVIQCNE